MLNNCTSWSSSIKILNEGAPQKFAAVEPKDQQSLKDRLLAIIEQDRKRIESLEKRIEDLQMQKQIGER